MEINECHLPPSLTFTLAPAFILANVQGMTCGKTCKEDRDDEWMGVSLARQPTAGGSILVSLLFPSSHQNVKCHAVAGSNACELICCAGDWQNPANSVFSHPLRGRQIGSRGQSLLLERRLQRSHTCFCHPRGLPLKSGEGFRTWNRMNSTLYSYEWVGSPFFFF